MTVAAMFARHSLKVIKAECWNKDSKLFGCLQNGAASFHFNNSIVDFQCNHCPPPSMFIYVFTIAYFSYDIVIVVYSYSKVFQKESQRIVSILPETLTNKKQEFLCTLHKNSCFDTFLSIYFYQLLYTNTL